MSDLKGQVGELGFTITVTRKDTGKVETFDMIGKVIEQPQEKEDDGRNPQHSGS